MEWRRKRKPIPQSSGRAAPCTPASAKDRGQREDKAVSLRKEGHNRLRGFPSGVHRQGALEGPAWILWNWIWFGVNMYFPGRQSRTSIRLSTKSVILPSKKGFKTTNSLRENKNVWEKENNIKWSLIFRSHVMILTRCFTMCHVTQSPRQGKMTLTIPRWGNWGLEEDTTSQGPRMSKWQNQDATPRVSEARAQDPRHHIIVSPSPGQAPDLTN